MRHQIVKPYLVVVHTATSTVLEGSVLWIIAASVTKVVGCVHSMEAARLVLLKAVKRKHKVVKVDCAINMEVTSSVSSLNAVRRMREEAFVSLTVVRSGAVRQGARIQHNLRDYVKNMEGHELAKVLGAQENILAEAIVANI